MAQKSIYQRWDGLAWVEYYFKTSADNIEETTLLKVMTADERTAISTYLVTFNAANKLLKLDANADVPVAQIPDLGATYLKRSAGSGAPLSGDLYIGDYKLALDQYNYIVQTGQVVQFYIDNALTMEIRGDDYHNFQNHRLSNVANPSLAQDAATKSWVEALVSVGAHPAAGGPAQIATTGNYTSFPTSGPITIDGVQFLTADGQSIRVLVKDQTTLSQRGVYTVSRASGNVVSWTKVTADSAQGILIFIEYGSTYNDWIFWNSDGTTWSAYSKVDTVVADESSLTKSGQTFSIKAGGVLNSHVGAAAAIAWSKLASEGVIDTQGYMDTNSAAASTTLATKLSNLFSVIKLLRGTSTYNELNSESIGGAYDLLDNLLPSDIGAVGYLMSFTNIATLSGSQTVDGVASGTDGKIIILLGQTTTADRGVYRTAVGAWTKLEDHKQNALYVATAGSANANKVYKGNSTRGATLLYNGTSNFPKGLSIISCA